MKKRIGAPPREKAAAPRARLLSGLKVVILIGIVVQTILPAEILPITRQSTNVYTAGLVLYTLGLAIAVLARVQLGRNWSDIEKSFVVSGHSLVARGLYRFVRHPIYTGDLLLLAGLELALNSWGVLGVIPMAFYVRIQAMQEERKLLESLPGYDRYYRQTSRFVPFLSFNGK